MSDPLKVQIDGDHYKGLAIQPIEYSMKNNLDACQHSVVKYVTRFRSKGGIKDLEKAKHFIDILMKMEKDKQVGTIENNTVFDAKKAVPKLPEEFRFLHKGELLGPGTLWWNDVSKKWDYVSTNAFGAKPNSYFYYCVPSNPN